MQFFDVIIIGAGAAGLMCAIEAGKRKRRVLILEHANKCGKKILMSGGGRCNFTNYTISAENYISHNPHFCKSALSRYTQWDFIELVNKHRIAFHEKTLGQLFCDGKSQEILSMLLEECRKVDVKILLNTTVNQIEKTQHFSLKTTQGDFACESLIVACGGLSIPTMGASPFGYKIAEQFGIKVWPTRAGLVPVTLHKEDLEKLSVLSGISVPTTVSSATQTFRENILFTHRGLSGPAILQISSYWQPGEALMINLLPDIDLLEYLQAQKNTAHTLQSIMQTFFPKRLVEQFLNPAFAEKKLATIAHKDLALIATQFNAWQIWPNSTEGYRTAEVTLGGVDCAAISSKTMQANAIAGLYFVGEVLDITGWLGGYNFQWAWSSGWAAGQVV